MIDAIDDANDTAESLHQETQINVVRAVEAANLKQDHAIRKATSTTTDPVDSQHETTKDEILTTLRENHTIMLRYVNGLQKSVQLVEAELKLRTAELKSIITSKIGYRKSKDRNRLQALRSSVTMTVLSLQTLATEIKVCRRLYQVIGRLTSSGYIGRLFHEGEQTAVQTT